MLTDDKMIKIWRMTMKVSFVNKLSEKKETLVIISDKKSISKIDGLNKNILNPIKDAIANENFNFKKLDSIKIIGAGKSGYSKIIIIGSGDSSDLSLRDLDIIGGKVTQLNNNSIR